MCVKNGILFSLEQGEVEGKKLENTQRSGVKHNMKHERLGAFVLHNKKKNRPVSISFFSNKKAHITAKNHSKYITYAYASPLNYSIIIISCNMS